MKAVKIVVAKFCSCVIPLTDKAKPFNKSMNLNFETRFLMIVWPKEEKKTQASTVSRRV